jgi:hypothetical protein
MARGAFVVRLGEKINIKEERYRAHTTMHKVCTWRGVSRRIKGGNGEIQRRGRVIG